MRATVSSSRPGLSPVISNGLLPVALVLTCGAVQAASLTWIGGDATWTDGSGAANWTPSDEPDSDDTAIFNTNNVVTLGSGNAIAGLTMSASIIVDLGGNSLAIAGPTTLGGAGTRLQLPGAGSVITARDITINSGGTMFLDGGSANVSSSVGFAILATASGGTLAGNGTITMSDAHAGATTTINNNGTITASKPPLVILGSPPAATLHLSTTDVDARIDLDGSLEAGVVNVGRNQTLDINVTLADIFNGSLAMSHNSKLDVSGAWILGTNATVDVDNGATEGIGAIPAGTATIAGSTFSQNSGTITVVDIDGTLQFDAPFSFNGGTLTNNGHVIFNHTATIAAAANLDMIGGADLTVGENRTVTINQTNFNFDGSGSGGTAITVNSGGTLNLNTADYDPDSATNAFDGTINLNDGDISVTTGDAEFVMDGVLNMSSTVDGQIVVWTGEPFDLGNDAGVLDADLNVSGPGGRSLARQSISMPTPM
jgi:hypothetical protein